MGTIKFFSYAHAQAREDLHSGRILPYTRLVLYWHKAFLRN